MPIALVTGASRGLGFALTRELASREWDLVVDARDAQALGSVAVELGPRVVTVPGDVADPSHRADLEGELVRLGGLDLLVNNASYLGPSPQPPLHRYPFDEIERIYAVNVFAPLALFKLLRRMLEASNGVVINVTSDAAVEPYEGWGGYGSSKAALDQLSLILGAEQPSMRVYAFDPGDMRTAMHQDAFPGEDISDRPLPESVVPALLNLIDGSRASGRYRASDLLAATAAS